MYKTKYIYSWFVYQNVHVICISLDEISLLAVLNSQLYLLNLCLEGSTHLLNLHYYFLIRSLSPLLHNFNQRRINQDSPFRRHRTSITRILLSILGNNAAPNFCSLIFELHIKVKFLIFRLNLDSWNIFDQNSAFQQTHQWTFVKRLIFYLQLSQQCTQFHWNIVVSLDEKKC